MYRSPMMPRVHPESLPKGAFNGKERRSSERLIDEGGHTIPRSPDTFDRKQDLLDRFRARELQRTQQRELQSIPERRQSDGSVESALTIPEPFTHFELGRQASELEPELPVTAFRKQLVESIASNQIVIVTAETGSGKTTQLPPILVQEGYIVYETQPRRIAASFAAQQIQKEFTAVLGDDAEGLAGCHTAGENTTVPGKTRVTVLTDGLRLVQEFGEREELEHEVLIIDEVHEWNTNIEMLIAQTKRLVKEKPALRVVIMSATMEVEKLADFFTIGDKRPPIIEIPGRNFEVERTEEPESNVVDEAVKYATPGEAILIFLPGVREIEDTMGAIRQKLEAKGIKNATILPLHSKLSSAEQEAVKGNYPGPLIICATNIAQTSLTIPSVKRVIMSGLERRTEIDEEGVQSLNLRPVSRADLMQQGGRCGRVENGFAILTRLNDDVEFIAQDSTERTDYPIPEILRTDVDRNVLLAANVGLDFADIEFFHPIESSVINRSKHALRMLGALDDEGKITVQGQRMIKYPMRPMYARMMTYAEDQNYSANVRGYVAATVSALEVGGMPSWLRDSSRDWREEVVPTDNSDHLSQLRLFIAAQQMPDREKYEIGLDAHNVGRAQELYRKVCKRAGIPTNTTLDVPNETELQYVRHSVTAGLIDYVYVKSGRGYVRAEGTSGEVREKSNRTTVAGLPALVVGSPVGVERIRTGVRTKESIVQNITAVTAADLGRVATWLCEWTPGELRWSRGRLQRVQRQLFRKIPTGLLREVEAESNPEALKEIERHVMTHSGNALNELKAIKKELEKLNQLTTNSLPQLTHDDLEKIVRDAMNGQILQPSHIDHLIREVMDEMNFHLDSLVSPEERQRIYENAPPVVEVGDDSLTLAYSGGIPHHRLSNPAMALGWPENISLPDGRVVKFLYKKTEYTVPELRQLAVSSR